jgi:hypothetical protein
MEINYFLSEKRKLTDVLVYLNEIKIIHYNKKNLIGLKNVNKEIDEINETLFNLDKIIFLNCEHNFVDDLIDITPDTSKHVTYCTVCEYTKK